MIMTVAQYLSETESSDTLKRATEPKATTTAAVELMKAFMKLDGGEKLNFLSKVLSADSNDAWQEAPDHSGKNRKSLRNAQEKKTTPTLDKEVVAMFDGCGDISEDFRQKATEVFQDRLNAVKLSEAIQQLTESHPELKLVWGSDAEIEAATYLAANIAELEEALLEAEQIKQELIRESQMMKEEMLHAAQQPQRRSSVRRSSERLTADLEAVDESNAVLMMGAETHHHDKRMDARLRYLEQTARVDQSAASQLHETWEMFR